MFLGKFIRSLLAKAPPAASIVDAPERYRDIIVPRDIEQLALAETENWASEDMLSSAKEFYVEARGSTDEARWAEVRQRLGLVNLTP